MQLIEVAFKGNRKEFFVWDSDEPPAVKAGVVVEADRGEDLGYVHAVGELAARRNAGAAHGYGAALPTRKARRLATADDLRRLNELRSQDEDARRRAMERVRSNDLVMKLSDAEWQWDRKKLTFYFTADKRVDFRTLVRELASMFRTRIELKQIGVRDEAKRLDGIGRCGRQYCSSSWLPELRPVNLGVAKDQRLSLNPSQISGACGRLMCCLRYEHEFYVQSRKRFPKEGKVIRTALGEEKVIANDIFRERVTLRGADGEVRTIPLAELRQEANGAGGGGAVPEDDRSALTRPSAESSEGDVSEPDEPEAPETRDSFDDSADDSELDASPVDASPPGVSEPDEPGAANAEPAADAAGDPQVRKPHRRRGRRGGRRNRGGSRSTPREDGGPSTPVN